MRCRATVSRDGFVLLAVLFVLLALFALSAPFLATARNADAASQHASDRVQLGLALDGAARRGRSGLQATHPAIDETPYYDGLDELDVDVMASRGTPIPTTRRVSPGTPRPWTSPRGSTSARRARRSSRTCSPGSLA